MKEFQLIWIAPWPSSIRSPTAPRESRSRTCGPVVPTILSMHVHFFLYYFILFASNYVISVFSYEEHEFVIVPVTHCVSWLNYLINLFCRNGTIGKISMRS